MQGLEAITNISLTLRSERNDFFRIRHHEDELEGAKEEDRKEGERLKKQAEEYEAEERQKAEETRRKALQQNAANRNQIEDVKFMKQVEETQYEVSHLCCFVHSVRVSSL